MISDFKKAESNYVLSATDYYPFGMVARSYTSPEEYRYGFNGQERETELSESSTSAEYWMYDGRLGRRWNVDQVVKDHESPYACFANNPIWFADPNGADSTVATKSTKGVLVYNSKDKGGSSGAINFNATGYFEDDDWELFDLANYSNDDGTTNWDKAGQAFKEMFPGGVENVFVSMHGSGNSIQVGNDKGQPINSTGLNGFFNFLGVVATTMPAINHSDAPSVQSVGNIVLRACNGAGITSSDGTVSLASRTQSSAPNQRIWVVDQQFKVYPVHDLASQNKGGFYENPISGIYKHPSQGNLIGPAPFQYYQNGRLSSTRYFVEPRSNGPLIDYKLYNIDYKSGNSPRFKKAPYVR